MLVQFRRCVSFYSLLYIFRSVTSGLRRPSPLTLGRGPRGDFRSECCTGGESMSASRVNCYFLPINAEHEDG